MTREEIDKIRTGAAKIQKNKKRLHRNKFFQKNEKKIQMIAIFDEENIYFTL